MSQPIRQQVRCVPHDAWYYPSEGCPTCAQKGSTRSQPTNPLDLEALEPRTIVHGLFPHHSEIEGRHCKISLGADPPPVLTTGEARELRPPIVDGNGDRVHVLKCHRRPFAAVRDLSKGFEYRLFDRDYRVGDVLHLDEFNEETGFATGEWEERRVTYMISEGFGIPPGYCIMGITPKAPPEPPKGRRLRELTENLLRSAINIAQEKSPKWYKNGDEKIAAILALKDRWDTEAAKILREAPPPESPTPSTEAQVAFVNAKCGEMCKVFDALGFQTHPLDDSDPLGGGLPERVQWAKAEIEKLRAKPVAGDTVEGADLETLILEEPQFLEKNLYFKGKNMSRGFVPVEGARQAVRDIVKMLRPMAPRKEAGKP